MFDLQNSDRWEGLVKCNNIMPEPMTPQFTRLLFVLVIPVTLCVQHLAKRLVFRPYPRDAWGSGLMVGFAIGAVLLVLQFVIAVFHYQNELSGPFFGAGLLTTVYAFLMMATINRLFPRLDRKHPRGFLLRNFQEHSRYIYICLFLISVISLVLGHVFLDPILLQRQVFRMVWAAIFFICIFVPSNRLGIHMGLFGLALVLLVAFVILLHFWNMTT